MNKGILNFQLKRSSGTVGNPSLNILPDFACLRVREIQISYAIRRTAVDGVAGTDENLKLF